jgi:WD40 repeat protein
VRVWNATGGAELAVLGGHDGFVESVAFSPDGRRIASGSRDNTVRVWNATGGAELAVLRGHDGSVEGVAFSPDGRRIASMSNDGTVRVWDAQLGACLEIMHGTGDVARIAVGAERFPYRALARGLELVVEDAATANPIARFPVGMAAAIIVTCPNGRTWAGRIDRYVCIVRFEEMT